MHKLKNLTLRQLTLIMSLMVVMLFLLCYFLFKGFWSFDREVDAVIKRQQGEVARVEILLSIAEDDLRTSLADYAAWDSMIDFTSHPSKEFIADNIGTDAEPPNLVDGILILDANRQFLWGGWYRNHQFELENWLKKRPAHRTQSLLDNVDALPKQRISSDLEYTVIDGQPYLLAVAKICNSLGEDCRHGYLLFLRQLHAEFIHNLERATGVSLTLSVVPQNTTPQTQVDHSVLLKRDPLGVEQLAIDIHHSEPRPKFLTIPEIYALSGFALLMLLVNMLIVSFLVRPIQHARMVLEAFQHSGGTLPSRESFYSREMRGFAYDINRLISELEIKGAKLQWQSFHDPLTTVANRRGLYDALERYVSEYHYTHIAIVLLDIDHFKQFNDNYGHLRGDETLTTLAKALDAMRSSYEKLVCRFGGEEFCLAYASDSAINVEKQLLTIRRTVAELAIPHEYSSISPYLTVSLGASTSHVDHFQDVLELIQRADEALYVVKNSGKDGYKIQ